MSTWMTPMPPGSPGSFGWIWRRPRPDCRRRTPTRDRRRLFLQTTGCFVSYEEVLVDGCLSQVVADDLAWQISVQMWRSRQPSRWMRCRPSARQRWLGEFDALCRDRDRIAAVARYYGVED